MAALYTFRRSLSPPPPKSNITRACMCVCVCARARACRWEDNIKMDLQEVGGGRGDWMELAQDRDRWRALVGTMRDFRVP